MTFVSKFVSFLGVFFFYLRTESPFSSALKKYCSSLDSFVLKTVYRVCYFQLYKLHYLVLDIFSIILCFSVSGLKLRTCSMKHCHHDVFWCFRCGKGISLKSLLPGTDLHSPHSGNLLLAKDTSTMPECKHDSASIFI